MTFDVLVTIVGPVEDHADAERLAHDLQAVVRAARTLSCLIEIRDVRQGTRRRITVQPGLSDPSP